MKNHNVLALFLFNIQGLDNAVTNQDVRRTDQLENKEDYKLKFYGAIGGVILAGSSLGVWIGYMEDKAKEEKKATTERELKEQDIEAILKLDSIEEWLQLCKEKYKFYIKTMKKIAREVMKIKEDSTLHEEQKEAIYKYIIENNEFAKDAVFVTVILFTFGFSFVLMKQFLNKYKNEKQIKNNPQLVEAFDGLLELLPLKVKRDILYTLQKRKNFQILKQKLYDQFKQKANDEHNKLRNDGEVLREKLMNIKINTFTPLLSITSDIDQEGLSHINSTMKYYNVTRLFEHIFDMKDSEDNTDKLLMKTIQNNSIVQQLALFFTIIQENLTNIDWGLME